MKAKGKSKWFLCDVLWGSNLEIKRSLDLEIIGALEGLLVYLKSDVGLSSYQAYIEEQGGAPIFFVPMLWDEGVGWPCSILMP